MLMFLKFMLIQRFCKKHNIKIDCFDGSRINAGKNTERNIALYMYRVHEQPV